MEKLKSYFQTGKLRVETVNIISANSISIIKLTVGKSLIPKGLTRPGGNMYTVRRYAACIRDLDYFLRCVTYAMFAGDTSILDELVLNCLGETYNALGVPIGATVEAIKAMKEVVTKFIGEEAGREMAVYFDYLCSGITTNTTVNSRQEIQRQENMPKETRESWEPKNYQEWLKADKLAQQLQKNGVDDQDAFEESAKGFFEAWSRMPSDLKRKVWREREVMAALCEKINSWKEIPGFLSVGVAQRMINGKEQLAGILNFEASNLPNEQYYKKFDLPKCLKVESSINQTEGEQQELIPIELEWMESFVKYNSTNVKSSVATSETISSKKTSSPILKLQSGDRLVGRNEKGRFNRNQEVTLTISVFSSDTVGKIIPQVLSVYHGFKAGYEEAYTCEIKPHK